MTVVSNLILFIASVKEVVCSSLPGCCSSVIGVTQKKCGVDFWWNMAEGWGMAWRKKNEEKWVKIQIYAQNLYKITDIVPLCPFLFCLSFMHFSGNYTWILGCWTLVEVCLLLRNIFFMALRFIIFICEATLCVLVALVNCFSKFVCWLGRKYIHMDKGWITIRS